MTKSKSSSLPVFMFDVTQVFTPDDVNLDRLRCTDSVAVRSTDPQVICQESLKVLMMAGAFSYGDEKFPGLMKAIADQLRGRKWSDNASENVFKFEFSVKSEPAVKTDGKYNYTVEQDTTTSTEVTGKGIIKWAKERVKRFPMVVDDDVWSNQEHKYVSVSVHNTVKRELIKVLMQYDSISWHNYKDYELREELTNLTLFGTVGYKKMNQRQLLKKLLDVANMYDVRSVEELMGRVDEGSSDE